MCQLNIYCVPKTVKKEKVIILLNTAFGVDIAECIDEEKPIAELNEDYSFFICAGMRCNCGSFLAAHHDYEGNDTYKELNKNLQNAEIERLERIRDFMEQKDYKKMRRLFDKEVKKLWKAIEIAGEDVRNEEIRLTDEVMDREDLSEDEKNRLMHEEVYPKVNELLTKMEARPQNIAAMQAYQDFIQKNDLMWQSWCYELKRTNPERTEMVEINDFISGNEGSETYEIEMPSNCIYDVIESKKRESLKEIVQEYEEIKAFIKSVLKIVKEIKLFAFWQDGATITVKCKKAIKYSDIKIDDIAFLKYNELLTVTR